MLRLGLDPSGRGARTISPCATHAQQSARARWTALNLPQMGVARLLLCIRLTFMELS